MLLLERDEHECVYFLIYFKALDQHMTMLSQILLWFCFLPYDIIEFALFCESFLLPLEFLLNFVIEKELKPSRPRGKNKETWMNAWI